MKRVILGCALVGALAFAAAASASPSPVGGSRPAACDTSGTPLVNVHYTLLNDYDSATDGHAWANDTIDRRLEIWQVGPDSYCAAVADQGTFVTFAGTSPTGSGEVSDGITGKLKGGYATTTFTGTFAPARPTGGDLGTFDLACSSAYVCPGEAPSYLDYFSSTSGDALAVWGWSYHTARNGDMVQQSASPSYSGDITG